MRARRAFLAPEAWETMEPIDALTEIAALLERERASRYRSKAFRAAAAAIAGLSRDELSDASSLRRRAGIGDSSFAVIQQALAGEVPDYLAELRARYAPARSALRALLRGDLHCHSDWSDGTTPIADMVTAARALGHEYLALTDHSPRLRVANGLSAERLREQLGVVAGLSGDGFTLLSGIEVDILDDGALDQDDALLDELDVVVASAHSKLRMDATAMTRRLVAAASTPASTYSATSRGGSSRGSAGRARPRPSTPARCSTRARRTASPWRSTRGPSAKTHPTSSSRSRSRPDACSRSTPTRMRRANSACSTRVQHARSAPGCRPSASSRRGRSTACGPGPRGHAERAAAALPGLGGRRGLR